MSEPTNRNSISLNQPLYRDATLDRQSIDEEAMTATLSFASEEPVERFYKGEIIQEVLDMESFDVSRVNGSGALLLNHDPDQQVGGITKSWVDPDGVARATVLFSDSQRGKEIFSDVKRGIRGPTSTGYELLRETARNESDDGVITVRFAARALEASLVGVPADATVGVGRAKDTEQTKPKPIDKMAEETKDKPEEVRSTPAVVVNEPSAEQIKAERAKGADEALKHERARLESIETSAERFADTHKGVTALSQKAKREGWESEKFDTELLNAMADRSNSEVDLRDFGMSNKEKREYSVVRAIACIAERKPVDGIEGEVSRTMNERFPRESEKGAPDGITGFTIPINAGLGSRIKHEDALARQGYRATDLDTVTSTTSSEIYPETHRGDLYIEFLRPNLFMENLGARILTGIGPGKLAIPRGTDGAQVVWQLEATATTQDEVIVDDITLEPHEASVYTQFTRKLLSHSDPAIEGLVRGDLNNALQVGLDTAWLTGNGTAKPLGVTASSGIGTVSTTLGAPTYAQALSFESDVAAANAMGESCSWVTTPVDKATMRANVQDSGSGRFVYEVDASGRESIIGYRAVATTMMTDSVTVFGNFNDYIGATFAPGIDILVDPYSASTSRKVKILLNFMADGEARHGASFSKNA